MKMRSIIILIICVLSLYANNVYGYEVYEFDRPSRDGIGKIYLGREISHVMGHLGAGWLERPERVRQERTDLLLENLPIDESSVVADIGAGTGYFTLPLAPKVQSIYAVDIQQEMLDIVGQRTERLGVRNVIPILSTETDTRLPENAVDLIFMVDAYHEFSHPHEMGQSMRRALKPGGKLVLIEYRLEDRRVPIKRLHKMSERQAREEMAALGLEWIETKNFLPQQHFMVFQKPINLNSD